MSKIKIKNFGPIKEGYVEDDGFLDVKKVTVFIGNQGSGKSTAAKLISTMMWVEKSSYQNSSKTKDDFLEYLKFHGIYNYRNFDTNLYYKGEKGTLVHTTNEPNNGPVESTQFGNYILPKIMYIPAERNTLSAISNIKGIPDNLLTFYEEFRRANKELNGGKIALPINDYRYQYDEQSDTSYIVGNGYKVDLKVASSGAQSVAPLFVVAKNLAELVVKSDDILLRNMSPRAIFNFNEELAKLEADISISSGAKNQKRKEIRDRYLTKCFINIIEEPEQNLYPTSQRNILNSLLEFNNMSEGNKLIMTTHSPYIISYLSLAIQADYLKNKIKSPELLKRLGEIVPLESTISANDVAIYQFDEKDGTIRKLPMIEGIPSDKNYLNTSLAEGNDLFDQLLEIEQEL